MLCIVWKYVSVFAYPIFLCPYLVLFFEDGRKMNLDGVN